MIIRVLDQNYFVQQTLSSEKGLIQYVCTNVSEDDGKYYRIVRIPIRDVRPELVRYLAGLYKAGLFHELTQYGNENEYFHVVLDCGPIKGRTLADRLHNDVISLDERLTMGENFLKYMIVSSIPGWFAESAMDTDHILFTDALDCAMVFDLEFLEHFEDASDRVLQKKLKDVLHELFSKELDNEKLPEMRDFLEEIEQGEYPELLNLYQEYRRIELQLAGVDEKTLEPRSFLWRLWDKIKSLSSIAEKYFGVVVYLIAIIYLIWSIWNLLQPTKVKDVYSTIGDEKIVSGSRYADEGTDSSGYGDMSDASFADGSVPFDVTTDSAAATEMSNGSNAAVSAPADDAVESKEAGR